MIEEGWLPFHAGMAFGTASDICNCKLLPVDVFVAVFALSGRYLEIDIGKSAPKVLGFVAIDTGCCAVRSQQRKLCLGVVETGNFLPRFRCMASLASRGSLVGARLQHALFELSMMRVGVATGAV